MNFLKRTWKKITAAFAALLAALGIYIGAVAQPATYAVTLTLPSQYVDTSALPLTAITSYTVAYKVGTGAVQTKVVNGPFTSRDQATTIPKALGTTCANAFVNVGAIASSATADVCVSNNGGPMPPTNLQVQ